MPEQFDVIVVGGAPAGLTAALYLGRQRLKTLVITKDIGGQALLTDTIQNYPGFNDIGGFELTSKFQQQAQKYGVQFVYAEVIGVEEDEVNCLRVKTGENEYYACAVILAFGKTPRDLGVPGEEQLKGKGVSYCAICDGPLFKGKTVAVVGVGDPALEAANYLSSIAAKVHVIMRTSTPIGDSELIVTLQAKNNLEFLTNTVVLSIKGEGRVEAVQLRNTITNSESSLKVDGVFVEMGYVAKTDFLKNIVQLNARKEIVVDRDGRTSHPAISAAGDITDTPYKQAVISAGQGATAALTAYNYISRLKGMSAALVADWKKIPI